MNTSPLVSVIIPAYKRPELLRETLQSVVAQTYSQLEIWVIDDGTPDASVEAICEEFPSVSYRKIPNSGGPARPRNIGIQLATGNYIAFLDDDDHWLPNKIETQVAILEAHPNFGLTHHPCMVMDSKGELTGEIVGKPGTPDVKHGDVSLRMMGNWTLMMPSVLLRKSLVDRVGYFNENMPQAGEDTEYWTRCSFQTQFYYHEEALARYRKHLSNSTTLGKGYVDLPLHLKAVLDTQLKENRITSKEYEKLRHQLIQRQLKECRRDWQRGLKNLRAINPKWFLTFTNVKLALRQLVTS